MTCHSFCYAFYAYRYLSVPRIAWNISLSDIARSTTDDSPHSQQRVEICIDSPGGGIAHAVCFWFQLQLSEDRDLDTTAESSGGGGRHRVEVEVIDTGPTRSPWGMNQSNYFEIINLYYCSRYMSKLLFYN